MLFRPTPSVLLVEDNSDDEALCRRALRLEVPGVRVRVLSDGQAAVDEVAAIQADETCPLPDLILLDFKLPKLTGLEVLEHIRSRKCTKRLPIVLFSSSSEQGGIDAAYEAGVNTYVVKPIDYEEYVTTVRLIARYWFGVAHPPRLRTCVEN